LDGWLGFEISAVVFPESTAPDVSGGRAVLRAAGGAVHACAGGDPAAWLRLDACAHTRLLALIAESSDFPVNDPTVVRPEVAPGIELRAALRGPLFGRLTVGLWIPLVRDDFYVELPDGTRRTVHQAFPVAGAASLEIGLGGPGSRRPARSSSARPGREARGHRAGRPGPRRRRGGLETADCLPNGGHVSRSSGVSVRDHMSAFPAWGVLRAPARAGSS